MKAMPVEPYVVGAPLRKKNSWPMNLFPTPNMKAKPNAQNSRAHRARVDDALLEDVEDLTGAGEAGLEGHEARLHEEHEEGGDEHRRRVHAVDPVGDRRLLGTLGVRHHADDSRTEHGDRREEGDESEHLAAGEDQEERLSFSVLQPFAHALTRMNRSHGCHEVLHSYRPPDSFGLVIVAPYERVISALSPNCERRMSSISLISEFL